MVGIMSISKKTRFLIILAIFITMIILINYCSSTMNHNKSKAELRYFENLDLKLKGIICNVEPQRHKHYSIITIEIISSNHKEHYYTPIGSTFCIVKDNQAVFVDGYEDFEIGDSITIGGNNTDLIRCVSKKGTLKLLKKRSQGKLFTLDNPKKRMKEIVKTKCK